MKLILTGKALGLALQLPLSPALQGEGCLSSEFPGSIDPLPPWPLPNLIRVGRIRKGEGFPCRISPPPTPPQSHMLILSGDEA